MGVLSDSELLEVLLDLVFGNASILGNANRPAPDPGSFEIAQRKAFHLEPHEELSSWDYWKIPGTMWKKVHGTCLRKSIGRSKKFPDCHKVPQIFGVLGSVGVRSTPNDTFSKTWKKQPMRFFEASGIPCHCLKGKHILGLFIKSLELFIKSHGTFLQKSVTRFEKSLIVKVPQIFGGSGSVEGLSTPNKKFPIPWKKHPIHPIIEFLMPVESSHFSFSRALPAPPMKNSMSAIGVCNLGQTNRTLYVTVTSHKACKMTCDMWHVIQCFKCDSLVSSQFKRFPSNYSHIQNKSDKPKKKRLNLTE